MSWLSDRLASGRRGPYRLDDLVRFVGVPATDRTFVGRLALQMHMNRRTVGRYRHLGLSESQADAWAARLGRHPMEVWPDWPTRTANQGDAP